MSICRDDLEAGQEGYKIVKRNGRYMLYTGTSFQVLDRVYYVETFSDITRDYENRDAQLRMFRMIMIIVMIVCLMLMAILNNMIVVPFRRLLKATKLLRFPSACVLQLPVRVLGVEAPPEIVGAIRYSNRW